MGMMQRVVVSGRVRQVGYRDWMKRRAEDFGITGFIRPIGETRMEILAEGEADALERFIAASHHGPEMARVDDVHGRAGRSPSGQGVHQAVSGLADIVGIRCTLASVNSRLVPLRPPPTAPAV